MCFAVPLTYLPPLVVPEGKCCRVLWRSSPTAYEIKSWWWNLGQRSFSFLFYFFLPERPGTYSLENGYLGKRHCSIHSITKIGDAALMLRRGSVVGIHWFPSSLLIIPGVYDKSLLTKVMMVLNFDSAYPYIACFPSDWTPLFSLLLAWQGGLSFCNFKSSCTSSVGLGLAS